jgi:hypothetical protein
MDAATRTIMIYYVSRAYQYKIILKVTRGVVGFANNSLYVSLPQLWYFTLFIQMLALAGDEFQWQRVWCIPLSSQTPHASML